MDNDARAGRITAVLGPTNTGKTHFAIERLLGHANGVIGLPLRLLAREVYDRVVAVKGAAACALVTGEEKIVPAGARYFVCTVEAMPLTRPFEVVAVDELQLAADPERGHVFTDRLLHARGLYETLFLGAESMRPAIKRLLPRVEFISRTRFSTLTHTGYRKLSRLPRRSAIVAFSAAEVYATAEAVRRQRGGAAVVMGALSPRTRNAQVAMYQAGEVDYLVATDAIGMGLNMDVDHVAFAGLYKFDGRQNRALRPEEVAQIAGRAGRHMREGTFGTTGEADPLSPDIVERVENHRFDTVKALQWRNSELEFRSLDALIASLEVPPPASGLIRVRDAEDLAVLKALAALPEVRATARSRDRIALLWQVCQIPDFRKTLADQHARLLARIWSHLASGDGRLPPSWVANQLERLDRVDGDLDTLATRIAHVRTWTYISHRPEWLADPRGVQERARAIEDRLSDALHETLTQRFVDRRSSVLMRRMGESLFGTVAKDGDVLVEGEFVGRLQAFRFTADISAPPEDARMLRAAAHRALVGEIERRATAFAEVADTQISLSDDGRLYWQGEMLARLVPGRSPLHPRVDLVANEFLNGHARDQVQKRLDTWIAGHVAAVLAPLVALMAADLPPAASGLAFRLGEGLGTGPAIPPAEVPAEARTVLKSRGVRFGRVATYMPAMLKPAAARLLVLLARVARGRPDWPDQAPMPGLVSVPAVGPAEYFAAAGFRVCGARAIRLDMLERLAARAHVLAAQGPVLAEGELMGLVGCSGPDFTAAMKACGFRAETLDGVVRFRPRKGRPPRPADRHGVTAPPDSPFAALAVLKA
ncbi:helicase-related protein [Zavarzinia sp. CC-PAN008]|uniref:helicase-related protein n=1 Tax=Zavarzinia sp. CC-PAN008 TaxID=3243332 RepID=UPI003F746AD0